MLTCERCTSSVEIKLWWFSIPTVPCLTPSPLDILLVDLVSIFGNKNEKVTPTVHRKHLQSRMSEQVATFVHLPDSVVAQLDTPVQHKHTNQ